MNDGGHQSLVPFQLSQHFGLESADSLAERRVRHRALLHANQQSIRHAHHRYHNRVGGVVQKGYQHTQLRVRRVDARHSVHDHLTEGLRVTPLATPNQKLLLRLLLHLHVRRKQVDDERGDDGSKPHQRLHPHAHHRLHVTSISLTDHLKELLQTAGGVEDVELFGVAQSLQFDRVLTRGREHRADVHARQPQVGELLTEQRPRLPEDERAADLTEYLLEKSVHAGLVLSKRLPVQTGGSEKGERF